MTLDLLFESQVLPPSRRLHERRAIATELRTDILEDDVQDIRPAVHRTNRGHRRLRRGLHPG